MDVKIEATVKILGYAKQVGSGSDVAHGRLRRFLHHVAELAGQFQPASVRHQRGFGRKDFSADLGPRQAGDKTHFILSFDAIGPVLWNADIVGHISGHD